MLTLKNISKDYEAGSTVVHALKRISLSFRKSEFVSILGPSGCGKTTLLNIIGGLDGYTDGDLVINSRSTKDFKDRDWDSYRNHSVGFVFQSYNLIPHQSVLQNVELALSLSGVSRAERKRRAKEALERVGLGDQLKKKPSEMSGGQMQRVAIARAIVNDPDIVLADEPTGALDSETSLQVMEILKEISKDRLVVMVTHNPDLAEQYSTRIVRMLDGNITSDSDPYTEEAAPIAKEKKKREKKPSMSFATSFGLSLKNLFSKKGRTILTSFAGSIGIIGIALIFAVSNGMTAYINALQEDTLASYPLTIEATTVDIGTLMQTFMGVAEEQQAKQHDKDKVYTQSVMFDMINAFTNLESTENDLRSFKSYIETKLQKNDDGTNSELYEALSGVQYTYDLNLQVYTKDANGNIVLSDTEQILTEAFRENLGMDMSVMMGYGENMGMNMDSSAMQMFSPAGNVKMWNEMLTGKDGELISPILKDQYDVIHGRWPAAADEIVLVVDQNNELADLTLYAMGLKSKTEISKVFDAIAEGKEVESEQQSWTYEELCDMEFRVVLPPDCYYYDANSGLYKDYRDTDSGLHILYNEATTLKVTGILRPNEDATSHMLSGSIGYTKALTDLVIEKSENSDALKAQVSDPHVDIFTGLPFEESTAQADDGVKAQKLKEHVESLDQIGKADLYVKMMGVMNETELSDTVEAQMQMLKREDMENTMISVLHQQMSMEEQEAKDSVSKMSDEDLASYMRQMLSEQIKATYAKNVAERLSVLPAAQREAMLIQLMEQADEVQCALYYDEVMEFSENDYESNLIELGGIDLEEPSTINFYASSFENKDVIEKFIAEYNEGVEELKQIHYTDYFGIMMSSITTIIDAITYVLIAFVAISLVVSSIMIGVITLISVQERTKEIGILRAIGASKKNVSGMFNAETVIIGFSSGMFGVLLTYLLCIPINLIIQHLTGIPTLSARLPISVAIALVLISMLLTLLSGIIPSRSAAKKDPVVALRTE